MKVIKEGGLTELIKIVKTSLNGKEPNISKKSGFNLVKTDTVEDDTNKLFTTKGAFDLKIAITNAYTSLITSTRTALETNIATKTPHGGYSGTSQQLKNEIDNKLPNPGYGGIHELGRYLDLHLSGSTADYDSRISVNTDKSILIQSSNGNLEIGPKNTTHCHIYTDRSAFYLNKEILINNNQVYHTGYKPSKADVGLSAVNNWGASSNIGANSTSEYATTNMVQQVNSRFGDTINWRNRLITEDGTNMDQISCEFGFDYNTSNSGISGSYISFSGLNKNYQTQIVAAYGGGNAIKWRTRNGDAGSWNPWREFWHTGNFDPNSKLSISGGTMNSVIYSTHTSPIISNVTGMHMHSNSGLIGFLSSGGGWIFRSDNSGNCTCTGTLNATAVYNAVWNDYAEFFPKKKGYVTEAGDIIALCEDDDGEYYELATSSHCMIVGAHSDCFGHLIGGEKPPLGKDFVEWNKDSYIPVALAGRLPVKFMGIAKKGMKVVPSETPGVGRAFGYGDSYDNVIGYIVENNNEEGIRRVKIKIGK